ncbi:MAG: putative selenium-dependent hydroxylase accessory protein YqeC [Caldilinea sp. CFX5]|nr:putative selenium-dependent hydroxylase accessory protein YqeC [Caldilinea sp. CFX5]
MTLLEALAPLMITPTPVVAFVGGGGKSSALFSLAADLVAAGRRVISTTTTHLAAEQLALAPAHLFLTAATPERLAATLTQHRHLLITDNLVPDTGKVRGVPVAFVSTLTQMGLADAILVEADGARKLPFKAPAPYEPVIPPESTLVVIVVGVDVFGRPLDEHNVHRPALVSALSGCPHGAPVTPEVVARVVAHPAGGRKEAPKGARVAVLLNKTDLLDDWAPVHATAALLRTEPGIACVVAGALRSPVAPVFCQSLLARS